MKLKNIDFLLPELICKIRPLQEIINELHQPKLDYSHPEVIIIKEIDSKLLEYYPKNWDRKMIRIRSVDDGLYTIEDLNIKVIFSYPVSSLIFEDIYITNKIKFLCEEIRLQRQNWSVTEDLIQTSISSLKNNKNFTEHRLERLFNRREEQLLNLQSFWDLITDINKCLKILYPNEIHIQI